MKVRDCSGVWSVDWPTDSALSIMHVYVYYCVWFGIYIIVIFHIGLQLLSVVNNIRVPVLILKVLFGINQSFCPLPCCGLWGNYGCHSSSFFTRNINCDSDWLKRLDDWHIGISHCLICCLVGLSVGWSVTRLSKRLVNQLSDVLSNWNGWATGWRIVGCFVEVWNKSLSDWQVR